MPYATTLRGSVLAATGGLLGVAGYGLIGRKGDGRKAYSLATPPAVVMSQASLTSGSNMLIKLQW